MLTLVMLSQLNFMKTTTNINYINRTTLTVQKIPPGSTPSFLEEKYSAEVKTDEETQCEISVVR